MENKYIALTFDDGPNTITTPAVLERLEKYGVIASFFVNGANINDESAMVMKKAFDMGCEIQNHSQNHFNMQTLSSEEIVKEIKQTDSLIENYVGVKPLFFRPPFIRVKDEMFDLIDKTFICGFCPNDWDKEVTKEQTASEIVKHTKNGDVILLHDSAHNIKTAYALDTIIPELLSKGFEFVTISELFKKFNTTPKKGVIYGNVIDF